MKKDILVLLVVAAMIPACNKSATSDRGGGAPGPVKPYQVKFETTAGDFVIQVHPDWAPIGAAHFKELVDAHYYDGDRFFRVMPGFVVQWGLNGDPAVTRKWLRVNLADEPVRHPNLAGTVTYGKTGLPNSRSTHVFINLADNSKGLDKQGFSPFGEVVEGMENVRKINSEYGQTPKQDMIEEQGNAYLDRYFPNLDSIKRAYVVE